MVARGNGNAVMRVRCKMCNGLKRERGLQLQARRLELRPRHATPARRAATLLLLEQSCGRVRYGSRLLHFSGERGTRNTDRALGPPTTLTLRAIVLSRISFFTLPLLTDTDLHNIPIIPVINCARPISGLLRRSRCPAEHRLRTIH